MHLIDHESHIAIQALIKAYSLHHFIPTSVRVQPGPWRSVSMAQCINFITPITSGDVMERELNLLFLLIYGNMGM